MNSKLRKSARLVQRAGNGMLVPEDLPVVGMAFFRGIINCPDCVEAIRASSMRGGSKKEH